MQDRTRPCDSLEQVIAGAVPERVVDVLHAVDVQHDDGPAGLGPRCDVGGHTPAVEHTCEPVDARLTPGCFGVGSDWCWLGEPSWMWTRLVAAATAPTPTTASRNRRTYWAGSVPVGRGEPESQRGDDVIAAMTAVTAGVANTALSIGTTTSVPTRAILVPRASRR